jgi:hypothetical protein
MFEYEVIEILKNNKINGNGLRTQYRIKDKVIYTGDGGVDIIGNTKLFNFIIQCKYKIYLTTSQNLINTLDTISNELKESKQNESKKKIIDMDFQIIDGEFNFLNCINAKGNLNIQIKNFEMY